MPALPVVDPKLPLPPPTGWFVLAYSDELKPGAVLSRTFAGEDLVLFRTESGQAAAIDAYCPHMGAHFGHGGCVKGETIECPFHAFRFDTNGVCVATVYGTKPPPKARARAWHLREQNGVVLAWHEANGAAPSWEVPVLDESGFGRRHESVWSFRGHPQETSENSVDLGHLGVVHGYRDIRSGAFRTEGPLLYAHYDFTRPRGFSRGSEAAIRAEIDIYVHGLGFSYVDVSIPKWGLTTRQYVFSTPTQPGRIELRLGMRMKGWESRGKIHPLLSLVPASLTAKLVEPVAFRSFQADVRQDLPMWENKKYLALPALAEGDGPVGKYRQWTRQFYPPSPAGSSAGTGATTAA